MSECACCAEKFNKSTRSPVPCYKCNYSACKTCVRTFLTNTQGMPHCMSCHTQFNLSFLVKHLNQSWTLNDYKTCMTSNLLSRELGLIPDTLPYAEAEKRKQALIKKNIGIKTQIQELEQKLRKLQRTHTANNYLIRGETVPERYRNCIDSDGPIQVDTRKKFIMACPGQGCKGFLSTSYKCGLCERFTCKDCITIKTTDLHVCVESDRESAKYIRENTKACPKCNERIQKIDGCDQMYCMARDEANKVCGCVWSWKSGEETPGVVVHNPHFFALQRELGYVPRTAGDVHCGGMPEIHSVLQLFRHIHRVVSEDEKRVLNLVSFSSEIQTLYRRLNEHVQYEIPRHRNVIRRHPDVMRKNRINYILTSISKEQFGDIQYRTEKEYQKTLETLHTLELIGVCGIETFQSIVQDIPTLNIFNDCVISHKDYTQTVLDDIRRKVINFHSVIDFCNDKMKEISITYHGSVPVYDHTCGVSNKKFRINGEEVKKYTPRPMNA